MESELTDHLLFRRQFILSSEADHALHGGKQVLIGARHHLSAHPDLELTHVASGGKSLTLLGFALDPDHPEAGNKQILLRLMEVIGTCDDVFQHIDTLGGRWALIVHDGAETIMLHDATAQRQVYHARDVATGAVVCASEPGLMAERLGLTMDTKAVDFIKSRKTDDFEIYWMPGDTSLYAEISALLPNHCLSLTTGNCRRFWPLQPPAPIQYAHALTECVRLLRGQLRSVALRHPLAVPMTAGWDSRLMLALCRDHADDLYAFTLAYPNLPVDARDVAVPAKLLASIGIRHHVIPYPKTIDVVFKEIFRRNNASANEAYCADVQALNEVYPENRVCVTGDAAEIVKCYYARKRPGPEPISSTELADFSRLGRHPFAIEAFARWLEDADAPPIDLLDLFCWEQMSGRWQSKVRAEYDMVQESFAPLNNRRLLVTMLTVDAGLRRAPDYRMFTDLITGLWQEVLTEPINPPETTRPSRRLIEAVKKTGVMRLVPETTKKKVKALLR